MLSFILNNYNFINKKILLKILNQEGNIEGSIDKFLIYINTKFSKDTSKKTVENTEKEVEFKVFLKSYADKEEILSFHNDLYKRLLSFDKGKTIFDGEIKDTRYYDTTIKNNSILDKENISMIRIRKQKTNSGEQQYIFTVKKKIGNGIESGYQVDEFEINVDENYGKKTLNQEYGLKEIKKSKKNRKEIEFEINVDGKVEKIKVAFDEYKCKKNSDIMPFFEVEARTEEILEKGYEKIEKQIKLMDRKVSFTTGGPTKILEEQERKKLIGDLNVNSIDGLKGEILESIINLLENESIYFVTNELLFEVDNKRNFTSSDNLNESIKKLLQEQIKEQINNNELFGNFFYRIIGDENTKNKPKKKFFDKFEREYIGYIEVFLHSIVDDYEKEIKDFKGNKKRLLTKIMLSKLNILLKSLLMFDDSLTRKELSTVLIQRPEIIKKKYKDFETNILTILGEVNIPNIWEDEEDKKEDNKEIKGDSNERILNRLTTSYSRAWASVVYKGGEIGDKELISQKLESIKKEQFEFLARQFSQWVNSPNRELKVFNTIKKLFLEISYHIYFLLKKGFIISDIESDTFPIFNEDFINYIIEEYNNIFFDKNNFKVKEKLPELFKYFITNIFENSKNTSKDIILDFKSFNKSYNKRFLKKENLDSSFEIGKNIINFDVWEKITFDSRLKIFIGDVLKFHNNGFSFNNGLFNKALLNDFARYEFKKDNEKKGIFESNSLETTKYIMLVKEQFKSIQNYFSINNIKKLSDIEKIKYLALNNINSFTLLVSFFQYVLKKNKQGSSILELNLNSDTFSEKVLGLIGTKSLEDSSIEFIASTGSAYNSYCPKIQRIKDLIDRIGNDKSINVLSNFDFEKKGQKFLMKDFSILYRKSNYSEARDFLLKGIETVRGLMNNNKTNIDKNYLNILENIDFPLDNQVYLKKLLEFQKYIYKIVIPYVNELEIKASNNTDNFISNFYKNYSNDIGDNFKLAPTKEFGRMLEKSIMKYGGDIEKIVDGTRATVFGDSFTDLSKKVAEYASKKDFGLNIKSIRFGDKIGNLFLKSIRKNGYRDATLTIVNEKGATVEIQFQLKQYYEIKTGKIEIGNSKDIKIKGKDFDILDKVRAELNLGKGDIFTQKEKQEIINYSISTGKKIPNTFVKIFNLEVDKENIGGDFNADYTYILERTLGETQPTINNKLLAIDKELFNIANGMLAEKEIDRIFGLMQNKQN